VPLQSCKSGLPRGDPGEASPGDLAADHGHLRSRSRR
jgi:hypothetical protein